MCGPACRNIRKALRHLGTDVPDSDVFDEPLSKAVKEFQKLHGHTSWDGNVGPQTRLLLAKALFARLLEEYGERAWYPMRQFEFPSGEAFPQAFLSYAKTDVISARRLHEDLKRAGVRVWFDENSLSPGTQWRSAIIEAIKGSRYFIAVMSQKSVQHIGHVQNELSTALGLLADYPPNRVFLLPVRIETCIPADQRLAELNWIDMFPDWSIGVDRLVQFLANDYTTA
jgi:hypothetical protein